MTTKVTYKKALKALKKLDPEFVYPVHDSCVYVRGFAPSCGVGQIMHKDFGIAIEDLSKWDNGDAGLPEVVARLNAVSDPADNDADLRDQDIHFTMKAEMLLEEFQRLQDNQVAWGQATDEAERFVKNYYGR